MFPITHFRDGMCGDDDLAAIKRLLAELSSSGEVSDIDAIDVDMCLRSADTHMYVARDGKFLVGMGLIYFKRLLPHWKGEVHAVIRDEQYPRQGIGERIASELLSVARSFSATKQKLIKLSLTSKPKREAANKLYVKLGFKLVATAILGLDGKPDPEGTNLYQMTIRP